MGFRISIPEGLKKDTMDKYNNVSPCKQFIKLKFILKISLVFNFLVFNSE